MRARALTLVGAAVCAVALVVPTSLPAAAERDPAGAQPDRSGRLPGTGPGGERVPPRWQHSSDGAEGAVASPLDAFLRGPLGTTRIRTWRAAPGLSVTEWDESTRRGPVRAQLITMNLATKGLAVDYAYAGAVRRTAPLTSILARHRAVAGINGDFFDIGDTGAPLGLGKDRQEGLLHGRSDGWNAAFYLDRRGRPGIGLLPLVARVRERPRMRIGHVNSPEVRRGGIGIYTRAWGAAAGYRVTGGQKRDVRMVLVRRGRVVQHRAKLPAGRPVGGTMLVGRGVGARQLRSLRKGSRVTVRWWLRGGPRVALTGNKILVRDGVIDVTDDREMHPRTAIGIDHDTGQLLLLVVDGRQRFSRGLTMVELASEMIDLGADEALNLDGGGSSTMVAPRPGGTVGVVNQPSDGAQRRVPNGLAISYRAP